MRKPRDRSKYHWTPDRNPMYGRKCKTACGRTVYYSDGRQSLHPVPAYMRRLTCFKKEQASQTPDSKTGGANK